MERTYRNSRRASAKSGEKSKAGGRVIAFAGLISVATLITSVSVAGTDAKTMPGSACLRYQDNASHIERDTFNTYLRTLEVDGTSSDVVQVTCPIVRSSVLGNLTDMDLSVQSGSTTDFCTLYGTSGSGSIIDSETQLLGAQGWNNVVDYDTIDVSGSQSAHYALSCGLKYYAKIYGYKHSEDGT
jgi:hypothetical protein